MSSEAQREKWRNQKKTWHTTNPDKARATRKNYRSKNKGKIAGH